MVLQSQRDCVLQPRVAESARLPWVSARAIFNPNGVVSPLRHRTTSFEVRNPKPEAHLTAKIAKIAKKDRRMNPPFGSEPSPAKDASLHGYGESV